jgi:Skp family chaperone for outer membrane proteins
MKLLVPALLLFAQQFSAVATAAANTGPVLPIAYVSMQRIAAEAREAKVAAAKLETMRQEKAREVGAKQKAVEAAHLATVAAGGIFQRSHRIQLQADESRQRQELQHLAEQAQADLQSLQHQLQESLRAKVNTIVAQLAKQKGVQVVLNEDTAVVWASTGVDLTAEILVKLNGVAIPKPARP